MAAGIILGTEISTTHSHLYHLCLGESLRPEPGPALSVPRWGYSSLYSNQHIPPGHTSDHVLDKIVPSISLDSDRLTYTSAALFLLGCGSGPMTQGWRHCSLSSTLRGPARANEAFWKHQHRSSNVSEREERCPETLDPRSQLCLD